MFLFKQATLLLIFGSMLVTAYKVEQLPSPRALCGEGPHWDKETQSLYYIDIYGPKATVLRYDYNENKTYAATVDNEPLMTFVLPVYNTNDEFLIGTKNEAKIIRWNGKSSKAELVRSVFQVEEDKFYSTNRFNDGKTDPAGRFYGGTQRFEGCDGSKELANASLYRFYPEHGVKQLRKNVLVSNGLTWNTKTNKFYFIDSCSLDVKEFDYDISTGDLSNERVAFSIKKDDGYVLDGMTSDVDGYLFIGTWGGNKVIKVDPTIGKILDEIPIPANQVTSASFGGPNLDILFVTTAARDGIHPPTAGHLYQVTGLNSIGLPGVKVKV